MSREYLTIDDLLEIHAEQIPASPDQAFAFISDAFEQKQIKFETLEAWLSVNTEDRR